MPIFIGDYLKDTGRLSTEAHGAYFLLMIDYWAQGAPPLDDDGELCSITRMSPEAWRALRPRLVTFFDVREGRWFHKRIESELEKARARAATAARNGARGGRPPAEGKTHEEPAGFSLGSENDDFENPEGNPEKSSSPSPSPSPSVFSSSKKKGAAFVRPSVEEVRAYCVERGNRIDAEAFVDFYESKGWKIGTNPMKDWRACVRTWERREPSRAPARPLAAVARVAKRSGEHAENLRL